MNINEVTLRDLASREAIRQCIYRYCRGVDRPDEQMIASVYWPDAIDDRGPQYRGPIKGWIEHIMEVARTRVRDRHTVGNILIEIDGDTARSETHYTAYHRIRTGPSQWIDEFLAGRFVDRFECRDGEWRIIHRRAPLDWYRKEVGQDPEEKGYNERGYGGGPEDPSFEIFPLGKA